MEIAAVIIPLLVARIIIHIVCSVPTILELIDDRKGDHNKMEDIVLLTIISVLLSVSLNFMLSRVWISWRLFDYMLFTWGIHFLFFDYAVVYLLRKNGVITATAKVFRYTGKSTKIWDQLQAKIKWWIRIIIRVIVFILIWLWVFR